MCCWCAGGWLQHLGLSYKLNATLPTKFEFDPANPLRDASQKRRFNGKHAQNFYRHD